MEIFVAIYLIGVILSLGVFMTWAKNGGLLEGKDAYYHFIYVFLSAFLFPYFWYVALREGKE